jgi:hypothetical protein
MRKVLFILILAITLLAACNTAIPGTTQIPITVQYTAAVTPWLAGVYNCAGANVVTAEQRPANFQDPQSFDLTIRIGQPENLASPAYQIGNEAILVIVNPQNPVKVLSAKQVRGLFTGQTSNWQVVSGSNATVQVWVYSSGEDIQQIFETAALGSSPVTTTARLATSPDEMAKGIASDVNAVGILTRSLKGGTVSDAFTATTAPVLALTKAKPQGSVQDLIACLQNKNP